MKKISILYIFCRIILQLGQTENRDNIFPDFLFVDKKKFLEISLGQLYLCLDKAAKFCYNQPQLFVYQYLFIFTSVDIVLTDYSILYLFSVYLQTDDPAKEDLYSVKKKIFLYCIQNICGIHYIVGIRYLDCLLNNKYLHYLYQPRKIADISIQFVKSLVDCVNIQHSQKANQNIFEQIFFQ